MNYQQFRSSKVQGFEDLNLYKQTRDFTNKIYEITRDGSFSRDYGLVDQIRRASVSIMSCQLINDAIILSP